MAKYMNSLTQAQTLLEQCQKRVIQLRQIISDHDEGIKKLSTLRRASTEALLDETLETIKEQEKIIEAYKGSDLEKLDEEESKKREKEQMAYFLNQKLRIKYNKKYTKKEKEEILSLLSELPNCTNIRDEDIQPIAQKSIDISLTYLFGIEDILKDIIKDIKNIIYTQIDDNNSFLTIFNTRVIYLILQLHILTINAKELAKEKEIKIKPIIPYQHWWIDNIFKDQKAYIGLLKWKQYIEKTYITKQQKQSWNNFFIKWINFKMSINTFGESSKTYNRAFDKLLFKYTNLKKEENKENIIKMTKYLMKSNLQKDCNLQDIEVETDYYKYKKKMLESKNDTK